MEPSFQIKTHGKWILAGEHAVLRGHSALVFPIPGKYIELFYWDESNSLRIDFNASQEETLLMLFWTVFEEALKILDKKQHDVHGRFFFKNTIPMGAGMGFSAAFCVSLAKWFIWKQWLKPSKLFEFARELENIFHGKSSGVDIAGAMHDGGVHFEMPGKMRALSVNWRPQLYLSHCGQISVTSKCVQRVTELYESDPTSAVMIDQQMLEAVQLSESALMTNEQTGLDELKKAFCLATNCFLKWELLSDALREHGQMLESAGALAYKPTGAGDGGYVLSLWETIPNLPFEMVAVF